MQVEQPSTAGDGDDDTAAIHTALAIGFDAALAGVVGADFDQKIAAARHELAAARAKATDITRFDLAATVARIVVSPWGWAYYLVPALPPEQHSWAAGASMPAPQLIAVGLVAPGQRDIAALVQHRVSPAGVHQAALSGWPS